MHLIYMDELPRGKNIQEGFTRSENRWYSRDVFCFHFPVHGRILRYSNVVIAVRHHAIALFSHTDYTQDDGADKGPFSSVGSEYN